MYLKFAVLLFELSFLSYSAFASGPNFLGEEINPRLKVNYLSQSTGKNHHFSNLLKTIYHYGKEWWLSKLRHDVV